MLSPCPATTESQSGLREFPPKPDRKAPRTELTNTCTDCDGPDEEVKIRPAGDGFGRTVAVAGVMFRTTPKSSGELATLADVTRIVP